MALLSLVAVPWMRELVAYLWIAVLVVRHTIDFISTVRALRPFLREGELLTRYFALEATE